MKTGIYKITSPSGKVYIGKAKNINSRKSRYKNLHCSEQPKIYRSIKKYGWEQHIFEIIEECLSDNLIEREIHWKQYYLDQVNGNWQQVLFCQLIDTGGDKSEETKQKISLANKGRKLTIETKQKMSSFQKGKKLTDKTKQKISLAKTGHKCYDNPEYKNHILNLHKRFVGIPKTDEVKKKISEGNKGKRKSKEFRESVHKWIQKPIEQYDLEGNFIKEWSSMKEASISLNINKSNISNACRGHLKTFKGYIWKYK